MAIPNNIRKEHLLKAIEKIDLEGIPKNADSQYYDVVINGKKYPPKLVVSYANLFANGVILNRDLFNAGIDTDCFRLLARNDFVIEKRDINMKNIRKVWFVTQGATFTKDRGMKFLWAPQKNKAGSPLFFWSNLMKVKKGDIIFNYSGGLRGVSIAKSDGYIAPNPENISAWIEEGYRVDIELTLLDNPIPLNTIKQNKEGIKRFLTLVKNKPFDLNGNVNEGYLYEFSPEAGKFLRDLYGKNFGNVIIDDFFDSVSINNERIINSQIDEIIERFNNGLENAGLKIAKKVNSRYICSLITKPFVILTGLSGSGKTRLAQAFARWICSDNSQFKVIPVGADWTNREPLLGYPNALEKEQYVLPDNEALQLVIEASKAENRNRPYFLILDEMNLSHVERYFADFLSAMESDEPIPLHNGSEYWNGVPTNIRLPKNLFIVGTVNIDETTYMFSPKVLDRANVIEFRVTSGEMEEFLKANVKLNMDSLNGSGVDMASSFVNMARENKIETTEKIEIGAILLNFFNELKKTGAEFGYRSAAEIQRFFAIAQKVAPEWIEEEIIDAAILQKLLPKVHGSRKKLEPILKKLGDLCLKDDVGPEINIEELLNNSDEKLQTDTLKYPLSFEKISRMYRNLLNNGFTSYAEA